MSGHPLVAAHFILIKLLTANLAISLVFEEDSVTFFAFFSALKEKIIMSIEFSI